MNPRIKELASQCWDQRLYARQFDQEMFAQLIVKECMRMCEVAQAGYLTHGLEKEAAGAISVKQYIEEYLGVEG